MRFGATWPRGTAISSAGWRPSTGAIAAARCSTDDSPIRPRQRGRDVADPRFLRGPLGVRAAHIPDPVEPRWRRRRELLAGLLAARPEPVPRAHHAPPEARPQEEPQAPPAP